MAETIKRGGQAMADAVAQAYQKGASDYYMPPLVAVGPDGRPVGKVADGDTVVFAAAGASGRLS